MKHSRGFTLIELLVVIAIIALLLSILMPSLRKVKEIAREVVCQTNFHGLSYAFLMYLEDNGNTYPKGWVNQTASKGQDLWFVAMQPYYEDKEVLQCPSASNSKEIPSKTVQVKSSVYPINEDYEMSYTINGHIQSFKNSAAYTDKWKKGGQRGSSTIPVLLDGFRYFQGRTITEFDPPPPYRGAYSVAGLGFSFMMNRHNGTNNVLFMDHSVDKVGVKELYTLKWSPVFNVNGPYTLAGGMTRGLWPEWMRGFKEY